MGVNNYVNEVGTREKNIILTSENFCSFYCVNVWKLWPVFFLWNFDFD